MSGEFRQYQTISDLIYLKVLVEMLVEFLECWWNGFDFKIKDFSPKFRSMSVEVFFHPF